MNTRTQGQVLLIGLMLIALVTTIVGTGVLRSTTSTQTTKQKEEANKAAEAAKGILEAGINEEDVSQTFTGVNNEATSLNTSNQATTDVFIYDDVVGKDEQYLFYLTDYDPTNNSFGSQYFGDDLTVYYGSEAGTCPLLEFIFIGEPAIGGGNEILTRYYTGNPGTPGTCSASNSFNYSGSTPAVITPATDPPDPFDAFSYSARIPVDMATIGSVRLLVVRPFFAGTKLGFGTSGGQVFKPQGRVISSTARTIDGAQKTETVYQAFPQIPLSLFATIF